MANEKRPAKGRAVFYTRDSGGKHECTPGQYISWAARDAAQRGLQFSGTPTQIDTMIREGRFADRDVFSDFDVQGHIIDRKGLNALFEEVKRDQNVSHVYIPRRDRLSRAEDPLEAAQLENALRQMGVWIIYMD